MKISFLCVALLLFVCGCSCLNMTCIMVSTKGNDTNADGSMSLPFASIQAAILAMKNESQKICLEEGQYNKSVNLDSKVVPFPVLIEGPTPLTNCAIGSLGETSERVTFALIGIPYSITNVILAFVDLYGPLVAINNSYVFASLHVNSNSPIFFSNSTFSVDGNITAPTITFTNCSISTTLFESIFNLQASGEIVISNSSVSNNIYAVGCGSMIVEKSSFTSLASLSLLDCPLLLIESSSFLNNSVPILVYQAFGTVEIRNSVFKWNEKLQYLVDAEVQVVRDSYFGCNDWSLWVEQIPLQYKSLKQWNNTLDIKGCPWVCGYNKYRPFELSKCLHCGPGYASSSKVATSCFPCSSEYVPSLNSFGCVGCNPGYFAANFTCNMCPDGYYQDSMNQTSCKPCPPGTEQYFDKTLCTPCSAGFYSEGGASFCTLCIGPFQQTNSDQTGCEVDTSDIGIIVGVTGGVFVLGLVFTAGFVVYRRKKARQGAESQRLIQ